MGDRLAAVALPWLVYNSTGSLFSSGAVLALYTLPYVLFGTFAGALVDRFNKRQVMVVVDVLRAGVIMLVPPVSHISILAVYVAAFAAASLTVLFDPAKLAIVPELVPDDRLLRANSLLSTAENITEVVGYGAAGLLLASVTTTVAFQVDAATYAASAVALACLRYQPTASRAEGAHESLSREIREGLRYLVSHRGLLANSAMSIGAAAGAGASYPLTFLFAVRILQGGPRAFGYLEAALGLGFLVGSLVLASAAKKVRKGTAMIVGFSVTGIGLVLFSSAVTIWAAMAFLLVTGVSNAIALIAVDTYVQQTVPECLRGRVWGSRFTLTQGTYAAFALLASGLATIVDIRVLIGFAGVLIVVPAITGAFVREIREA